MLVEIETNAIELLKRHWNTVSTEGVAVFDINQDFEDVLATPAVSAAIEVIDMSTIVPGTTGFGPVLSLYQVFKNVGKPDQRRHGIYPIILATVKILGWDDLDLDIDALEPVGSKELYHETLKKKGLICFRTQFKTSFDLEKFDTVEDAGVLLSEGLYYYSQEDELVAHDIINLEGE